MRRLTYDEILTGINLLDTVEQLRLLEELATTVRRRMTTGEKRSVLELRGLGKETWQDIDVQEYVERERASWSG
jgi:hypothetical protein